jgi:hypothetical protein
MRGTTELRLHNDVATINVGTPLGLTFRDEMRYEDTPATTSAITYSTEFNRADYAGTYGGVISMHYDHSYMTILEVCV